MLVGFIGCPCSGKTTTAASVFARLKRSGVPAEFIMEQARTHIAQLKVKQGLKPSESPKMDDVDQLQILQEQLRLEKLMLAACGDDVIVISDGCTLNSLLYIKDEANLNHRDVQAIKTEAANLYDLLFYVSPIEDFSSFDPNRVHDREASLAVDAKIPALLDSIKGSRVCIEIAEDGPDDFRQDTVFTKVLGFYMNGSRDVT